VWVALVGIAAPAQVFAIKFAGSLDDPAASSREIQDAAMIETMPTNIIARGTVMAKGLVSPDGIARDMDSGDVYVSIEDAASIVRIKPDGSKQVLFNGSTPLYSGSGSARKQVRGLRSPEGLALDGHGKLYVVEDVSGGRLISYDLKQYATNSSVGGSVVSTPLNNSRVAWESVDVGPLGQLLLAGSTLESSVVSSGDEAMFGMIRGAILYRDAQGDWWLPMNDAMVSYSAVCFSADGKYAFFACELTGAVGCLDLQSHRVRTYQADKSFHAPEGLCALPDGSALVAEEGGKIYRLDPMADKLQLLFNNKNTIESVLWDGPHRRLLVTDDQRGVLLSLELKDDAWISSAPVTNRTVIFEDQYTVVEMIPDQCPAYLAKVLELGGYVSGQESGGIGFREFAQQYCLVAIDAEVNLLLHSGHVADPIKRIQFVIVAPYLMGFQGGELIWSSSGFVAVKESGKIVKTQLVSRQVIRGDLMESRFTPMGGKQIALPMPFSTRIDTDGTAAIHFMGMGVMPDYLIMLNTIKPDLSVMLVMKADEKPQQYKVSLPPNQDGHSWVIALKRKEPEIWKNLSIPQ
jgi:sugar lactone lactonase YvrE